MPDGWAWCRLGELFYHTTGKALKKSNNKGSLRKYITTSNLYWNKFDFTEVREMYFTDDELDKCTIKKGDLVLCNGGDVGRAAIWNYNEDICYQNHVSRLRPKIEGINNSLYLYLLMFYKEQGMLNGKGVGITSLSANDLLSAIFPLPPLNEQNSIVTSIENIFEQIEHLDQEKSDLQTIIKQTKSKILDLAIHGKLVPQDPNDEPAEELLKRIVTSDNRPYKKFDDDITFSLPKNWEWCYLGDICKVSSAKRVLQQDWKDSGIPFYRAREIAQLSNNENVKDDLFITPELYDELKNKYGVPVSGDLMISAVGTIGKVYIVKESDCFYYKDASVICFSKKEKSIDSKYLKLCLESGFLQNQIYSQSTGTTVDTITINKAQEYLFPLPNIKEQQRIVSKIEELFLYLDTISSNLE